MVASRLGEPIESFASNEVPVIDKDYSLAEVLKSMEKAKIDRAFLTEEGRLRGVVTYRDILDKLATVRTRRAYIGGLHGSNFMNEPVKAVSPGDPFSRALETMASGMFTSVPVTGGSGEVIASLTRYDVARVVRDEAAAADAQVKDYMKTFLISASLRTRILHVRQLIYEYDVSVVPVLDEGRFVGVVGLDEILNVFMAFYSLQRGEPKRHTPLKYVVAADAIRMRPPVVTPDSSMAEAADKMISHRYRAIIVVDGDKPVGYISGLELSGFLLTQGRSG
ncbi:MAG: CBS domain-containing protein [Aeropyrum sp.]|nr:CBS domain-containing protein [Aeropyrum sp.]